MENQPAKKKIWLVFGTRPEAIKMVPLVDAFARHSDRFDLKVCVTGQHKEMLNQVLEFFEVTPDFNLSLMTQTQTLSDFTTKCLTALESLFIQEQPDLVIVQGDTNTAFAGALAAFYQRIPVAHVEAGLRSWNIYSPFPEEMNRKMVGQIATLHFAPTEKAVEALRKEGITQNVSLTTNTVVDALLKGIELLYANEGHQGADRFAKIDFSKRTLLVTGHRRESFGEGFKNICLAIKEVSEAFPDIQVIYPVHLNPNVRGVVETMLGNLSNIHLLPPVSYPEMIMLMKKSYFILTDSGGVQEEAPTLGKPILIMREVTERTEGIEAGAALLVGTETKDIVSACRKLLTDAKTYQSMSSVKNPYGDGKASERIVSEVRKYFS